MKLPRSAQGFTLIELLTVIAIIAVLMGLLFSAMGGVKDSGNKTKAKNDLVQIVTAVKAYYTEYGKYPLTTQGDDSQAVFTTTNSALVKALTAKDDTLNPRKIVFLEPPNAKDPTPAAAKGGLDSSSDFHDPWGTVYCVALDGDYDNTIKAVSHSYTDTNFASINTGVIAWSYGKDRKQGTNGDKKFSGSDDIVSWQ